MNRAVTWLRKLGVKDEIQGVAPTQKVMKDGGSADNVNIYVTKAKAVMLDRWLDATVVASGSDLVFFLILSGLLVWALLGIKYGTSSTWQVLISDIQAILSYLFDSLLVRQQMNGYDDEMMAAAQMQSRVLSHARMFNRVGLQLANADLVHAIESEEQDDTLEYEMELPRETLFGRAITVFSQGLGHIITVIFFWIGVFVWIGIGSHYQWSDDWQLYMNSASSALMVLTFSFLANVRERHAFYLRRCFDAIFNVDSALEVKLRFLTGDTLSNDAVIIPAPKVNRIQRAIFCYADFVGTLVGVGALIVVIAVWVAIGPVLQFSSNWWLLIGTYAGLIGMNDGFVLRNMQNRLGTFVKGAFEKLDDEDEKLFAEIGLNMPERQRSDNTSLTYRVSEVINRVCAHELTVLAGVLVIIGLIIAASALRWSLTGQLLCNVPPSLIESFFMIILITGHNTADHSKRVDLKNLYDRRLRLLSLVTYLESLTVQVYTTDEKIDAECDATVVVSESLMNEKEEA